MLVPTNKSKEIIKNYEELRSKIRDLIRSITNWQQLFHKTNTGQNALSFIGPALWNKVPEEIKNLNAFKHNLMKHSLKELGKSNF